MESLFNTITTFEKIFTLLLLASLVLNCFTEFTSVAQLLPKEEVEALETISSKLQMNYWPVINQSFCSEGNINWDVICNCNNTVCHVTKISMNYEDLRGELLAKFANFSYLQEIKLARNYINGTIPASFGQLPLTILSLSENLICGSIPKEIGNITTLEELVLENNQLGGPLPWNLGNLNRLSRLCLSGNNFTGTLPIEFSKLKNLTEFTISGSNLSGKIPDWIGNWTRIKKLDMQGTYMEGPLPTTIFKLKNLIELSLLGNQISGSIPEEIGDLAALEDLVLENNQLGGNLPRSLGNLSNLSRLRLSANNFTGTLPIEFSNLKNLTEFTIDGSNLSGKVPDWIGNWTGIERLDMQGTSMEGPLPTTISQLKYLFELRISDVSGSTSRFPDLRNMTNLVELTLRNCLITDSLPDYIGEFTGLTTLDLSFNRLTGKIPETFPSLNIKYMFLNNNSLSGIIPDWIPGNKYNIDIDVSYNNFTKPPPFDCQSSSVNLASSHSSVEGNSIAWCLKKDLPCSRNPQYHSLFINCGGNEITPFEGNEYEADFFTKGPSYFYVSPEKWAYSSTGVFLGNRFASYIANNSFSLNVTNEIYKTARLAPTSLKYYGLCLRKGSYKVRLHFAEIMFSNDQTFSSLGKRIFDVSIQGSRVLKDFNIMEVAKHPGEGIYKEFDDIFVNGSTLEIHLYWSGKGTNAIPERSVYGPLISAISVTPNYDLHTGLFVGSIVGIVAASCVVLVLILLLLRMKGYLGGNDLEDKELQGLDLQIGYFTLRQIKDATSNFDLANKIGEGGFGPVYKGILSDGAVIAVKQLSSKSKQGNREFVNEIGMISALQHPNLVRLYGCCIEGNQLLLIYEYLENNSLARALFGTPAKPRLANKKEDKLRNSKGLAYLHEESRLKIVHRDIKATNVLLDKDLSAKISDFGLAKLDEEENTHISTRIAGTIGYMAPEYAMRGYLTDKADVYSFGVVLLEIVSGKSNTNYRPKEEFVYLLDWAYVLQEQGNLLELVDPIFGSNYSKEEAMWMLNLSLLCTNPSPTLRPSMSSVVSMLEGNGPVQAPIVKRSSVNDDLRFKAFEQPSLDSQTHFSAFSQDNQVQGSISMDGPWIDSSTSIQSNKNESMDKTSSSKLLPDLYDVKLD